MADEFATHAATIQRMAWKLLVERDALQLENDARARENCEMREALIGTHVRLSQLMPKYTTLGQYTRSLQQWGEQVEKRQRAMEEELQAWKHKVQKLEIREQQARAMVMGENRRLRRIIQQLQRSQPPLQDTTTMTMPTSQTATPLPMPMPTPTPTPTPMNAADVGEPRCLVPLPALVGGNAAVVATTVPAAPIEIEIDTQSQIESDRDSYSDSSINQGRPSEKQTPSTTKTPNSIKLDTI